ncbi:accessory Sec system S-layer assembly protein [Anoxybacillus sp. D401a]|uniref:accessory Sec system S-layer assembly protein n=1 Tax=Anoxybacillus sp. D401a TaxID=575112 RepID=UPI003D331D70
MLPFFKKKKQGEDSTIQANQLFDGTHEQQDEDVHTTLSIHPLMSLTTEQKYYFQYMNNELPPLKKNQVSLSGIEWKKEGENYVITAFVRNSLDQAIRFDETPLLFIGPDGQVLGRKIFPMHELGDIPPRSSRPWFFVFNQYELFSNKIPQFGWKLSFELRKKHTLDLDESWQKALSKEDKLELEQFVRSLPRLRENEVNMTGLQATIDENGNLVISLLIRNGTRKHIQLKQLPLLVKDSSKEIIARGLFTLDLEIKANTSKPWTFVFPKELILKENIDLSQWDVYSSQS